MCLAVEQGTLMSQACIYNYEHEGMDILEGLSRTSFSPMIHKNIRQYSLHDELEGCLEKR
jgi:hypothetical protein